MKGRPPPDGSLLPENHRAVLFEILALLDENQYKRSLLAPKLPGIVDKLAQLCGDDDLLAWCNELTQWVRWYRVPAYWLTFILQLVTQRLGSVYGFATCQLYADAQTVFADDLALNSLETAYVAFKSHEVSLGPNFASIGKGLTDKLRYHYEYYRKWSQPFAGLSANPIADNLYHGLCQSWLAEAAAEHDPALDIGKPDDLRRLIAACNGDAFAHTAVLARHFLGLALQTQSGSRAAAIEAYAEALADARRLRIDTEIGHLYRLLGAALAADNQLPEARHNLEQALAFERAEPFFIYTSYWQALSARELGDVLFRQALSPAPSVTPMPGGWAGIVDDPQTLLPARAAYHDGRMIFGGHLTICSPFPVARAAKQQLFRTYSNNAVTIAAQTQSTPDLIAELEWNGPRQATELVTEIAAARQNDEESLASFRRGRAETYRTLTTAPATFEEYLDSVIHFNTERRRYFVETTSFDQSILKAQQYDDIAQRVLALRIPDAVFLLFHIGEHNGLMVLMDLSSGVAAPYDTGFGDAELRAIHTEYEAATKAVSDADRERVQTAALDRLLSQYATLLAPLLEPVIRFLPGKHLKIFPRLAMNAVPLHALSIQGKTLVEHCATVSYGQTLGLFLQNHSGETVTGTAALRVVVGEGVPVYDLILPKLGALFGHDARIEHPATWPALAEAIAKASARDTLFACHGIYAPADPEKSFLQLNKQQTGRVQFSDVFAELDLRGCRSVIMGACESGLARAEIAAEYLGLPGAMLSSGVRSVIGALWKVPQLSTAVIVLRLLELMRTLGPAAALSQAQREAMAMTNETVAAWLRDLLGASPELPGVLAVIAKLGAHPFAHPYQWAGLQAVGDL
jgi:CHAT domain-containing protein